MHCRCWLYGFKFCHLSNLGYSVAVLDAHRVGFGASGRNGGQLAGQRVYQDELVNKVGENKADKMWHLANDAVSTVKDLIKQIRLTATSSLGRHIRFNSKEVKELQLCQISQKI